MPGNSFPCVVSFYTVDTPYEDEVQNLIASCKQFGLETQIVGVPSQNSWELNCAYKPFFILEMASRLQRPLLWVDADGVFIRPPENLEVFSSDFAVRLDASLPDDHDSKVISSTIYVNNTPAALQILAAWRKEVFRQLSDPERTIEFWDQIALRNVLLAEKQAKISPLPLSYTKIFDHPDDVLNALDPVIVHYQASRRFKNHLGSCN